MKSILSNFLIFATGAAIGSVVAWRILKTKYDRLVNEEVDSVRKYYFNKYGPKDSEEVIEAATETVNQILDDQGYTCYSNTNKEVTDVERPRVIAPEEFGEVDYETISLTYYADGVLADDMDDPVDNVDDIIGLDSLNHFGEYEDDSVFVRNDRLKCDYEILFDSRNYSDVKQRVYPHEVEE